MPKVQSLFHTHPLYKEARARLAQRLEDIKRDFPTRLDWTQDRTPIEQETQPAAIPRPPLTGEPPQQTTSPSLITACLTLPDTASLPDELAAIYDRLDESGLFLGVVAGSQTLHELRTSLLEAELALTGGASPRVSPFPEPDALGRLLVQSGFALPVVDIERIVLAYPDLPALMRDLRQNGAANTLSERSRRFAPRHLFEKAQDLYAARFPAPDGGIAVTAELVFLHGWKEHNPLRGQSCPRETSS